MIANDVFTKEWIINKSNTLKLGKKKANPELIEKVTKAFHLLECLVESRLEFVFKGGTSLLLINKPQRFSIDIDIIVSKKSDEINKVFDNIITISKTFKRYSEVERKNNQQIPKQHIKFYYDSQLNDREGYILLDILYEENHYAHIIQKGIVCDFIEFVEPIKNVRMPSVECILADKLTAFAPNTTGIKYEVGKELEIIKQLFDIGNLFDQANDISTVKDTFTSITERELAYRSISDLSYVGVLDDIFDTAIVIAFRNARVDRFSELERGIQMIRDYIFSQRYNIEEAVVSASKAAYIAMLLKYEVNNIEFYDSKMEIKEMKIVLPEYKNLNSIKAFSPEGFYYWYKTLGLRECNSGMREVAATLES